MPILLGALLVIAVVLSIRLVLSTNPKVLLAILKGILAGGALIGIMILMLSGRLVNVITGLIGLMLLLPMLKKLFTKIPPSSSPSSSANTIMSVEQARDILGVSEKATAKEIKEAHRRIIQKIHPDQGGSTYLAAQVNQAKEVLLKKH
jgi:DnaJ family protein C protein 19